MQKFKIVILDGHGANPGDISWDPVAQLGETVIYDRTPKELVVERSIDADAILVNKTLLPAETLRQLPRLKYIGVLATGTNVVDIPAVLDLGITVTNIPAYSTDSVAQAVFALIFGIANQVEHYTEKNRKGAWAECKDFCYWDTPLIEIAGKQIGIIGFGNIGSRVAAIASAFKMKVAAFTSKPQEQLPEGVVKMSLEDVLKTSDIVSLHCPLTEGTRHMINKERLAMMKSTAILINTGRGPLVDENALAEALEEGQIFAAGIDVMSQEPPQRDNPLFKAPRCIITPHIAWATREARLRLVDIQAQNLKAFLEGKPTNLVTH